MLQGLGSLDVRDSPDGQVPQVVLATEDCLDHQEIMVIQVSEEPLAALEGMALPAALASLETLVVRALLDILEYQEMGVRLVAFKSPDRN